MFEVNEIITVVSERDGVHVKLGSEMESLDPEQALALAAKLIQAAFETNKLNKNI